MAWVLSHTGFVCFLAEEVEARSGWPGEIQRKKMGWLEIISVRTTKAAQNAALLELCRKLRAPWTQGPSPDLKFYCSVGYDTDLSVHIHWQAAVTLDGPSAFGLEVRSLLSDFGLISHTLWREPEPTL